MQIMVDIVPDVSLWTLFPYQWVRCAVCQGYLKTYKDKHFDVIESLDIICI